MTLKLLPSLDIYRGDLIPQDLDRSKLKNVNLDGVLLSHAHMDHAGSIGLLGKDVPIYSSAMSAVILKALQDSGRSSISREIAYTKSREKTGEKDRVLKTRNWRKSPTRGRNFYIPTKPDEEFLNFWRTTPGGRNHEAGKLEKFDEENQPVPFENFEVSHSIFGSTAYSIITEDGRIIYTGDLRFHGERGDKTEKFVQEASKNPPEILITEGTRVGREEIKGKTEEDVYQNCLSATEEENNLVVADFSPRNFERLETFLKISDKTGRKLVVTTGDAYLLDSLRYADEKDRVSEVKVYKNLTSWKWRNKWEKQILEKFEDQTVDPQEIAENPTSFILCFSFWDINNLLDINPRGGKYIYSTSEAFSEEQKLDVERLWQWLQFFDLETVGFSVEIKNGETQLNFKEGYHCSGHATPEELLEMIEKIDPKTVVPVHTENPEFFKKNIGNRDVKIIQNGESVKIG